MNRQMLVNQSRIVCLPFESVDNRHLTLFRAEVATNIYDVFLRPTARVLELMQHIRWAHAAWCFATHGFLLPKSGDTTVIVHPP